MIMQPIYPQGGTPARDPAPTLPAPRTFVKFGDYMICSCCKLAAAYCNCNERAAAESRPNDGPEAAALAQRIKDAKR